MIDLTLHTVFENSLEHSVHKVAKCIKNNVDSCTAYIEGTNLKDIRNGEILAKLENKISDMDEYEIWIVYPDAHKISRFFRPSSNSNTILLTERCDQRCIMCSQPPRNLDYAHFELYKEAIRQIDHKCIIGISGGEPTLFKKELIRFIDECSIANDNVTFHVLTNAQHFETSDIQSITSLRNNIIWAVPIYSNEVDCHDRIVGKQGAFRQLMRGLAILARASANVEIRTVILRENVYHITRLANFIGKNLPWINTWSLMQLEKKGFAVIDWDNKFFDTSEDFHMVEKSIEISCIRKFNLELFNFPRCTVPPQFRKYTRKSISDWKRKYLTACNVCSEKELCGGVFEWYDDDIGYNNILAIQ
jgi:His-Xaa-Ser system radical SAM maturase HxsC